MAAAKLETLLPLMEDEINSGGEVRFKPRGTSMLPFLMEGRDEVILVRPPERLKVGDIPFYRRTDGSFILHRVVAVGKDGSYTMCGDNQFRRERGIMPEQIIGVVKAVYRKGKYIPSESLFFRLWGFFWPGFKLLKSVPRRAYHKLRRILGL